MAKVQRSARADEDLIEIWWHLAAESPAAADRLIDQIEDRWRQLEAYPLSGAPRDDVLPGIRQLVVGRYVILYRLDDQNDIRLLRVLHGHRDLQAATRE